MPRGRKKIKFNGETPIKISFERMQTGIRLERKMLKVLRATAEYLDVSLGELIEVIVIFSFEGKTGFSKGTLKRIEDLKKIYEMNYGVDLAQFILFADR